MGKQCKQWQTLFSWAPKSLQIVIAAMKLKKKKNKTFALWEENYDKVDSILKRSTGINLTTKVFIAKAMVLSSTHVWKWELDLTSKSAPHMLTSQEVVKEGWALKNWCFWTVVLGKTLESSLDSKFALEMNRDHSFVFEIAPKYCVSDSFIDYEGYSISSKGFLPTVVDIMVIWIKFAHSSPF